MIGLNKNRIQTPYIIAEIAQGFEGDLNISKLLIKSAALSGADAVKFQLVIAKEICTPEYEHFQLFKKLEMNLKDWKELKLESDSLGIELIFDVFGIESLKIASELNISTIKIHGTDILNLELLYQISKSKVENIILGSGGAYLDEIEQGISILNTKKIIVMTGFQGYPTKPAENQISRISVLNNILKKYDQKIELGFADHPENIDESFMFSLLAIGSGAKYIEKHLTLSSILKMEDYESALNPDQFSFFVSQMKLAGLAVGEASRDFDFGMSISEKSYRKKIRKDVVASKNLSKGHVLNKADIKLKRTGNKNAIKSKEFVIGKKLKNDIQLDNPICKIDLK